MRGNHGCIRGPISIHAPRMGSDIRRAGSAAKDFTFQSTLPVWGATLVKMRDFTDEEFQSTLPVWGATRVVAIGSNTIEISIHAPRMGSDKTSRIAGWSCTISIHAPRMGSDKGAKRTSDRSRISIHAPRMGSDQSNQVTIAVPIHFNPRSPYGERHKQVAWAFEIREFQSTLPVWGATTI